MPGKEALAERATLYVAGKGALRFPHTEELPLGLVEDAARWFAHAARRRA